MGYWVSFVLKSASMFRFIIPQKVAFDNHEIDEFSGEGTCDTLMRLRAAWGVEGFAKLGGVCYTWRYETWWM